MRIVNHISYKTCQFESIDLWKAYLQSAQILYEQLWLKCQVFHPLVF